MKASLTQISSRLAIALAAVVTAAMLLLPGSALADSMTLSINPQPVAGLTSQIGYTASSEEGTLPVIAANNPGVPCAATPAGDQGVTLTPSHLLEGSSLGQYTGAVNWKPPSTGAYTVCGWLEVPAGLIETDGGPITASTSLPLDVRSPQITLKLSFPRRPVPGHEFTLDLVASSEATRQVVVEGMRQTARGCPVNYAAEDNPHLIERRSSADRGRSRRTSKPSTPAAGSSAPGPTPRKTAGSTLTRRRRSCCASGSMRPASTERRASTVADMSRGRRRGRSSPL